MPLLPVSPAEDRLQESQDLITWFMAASQCLIMSADRMDEGMLPGTDPLVAPRAQQRPKRELWEAMEGAERGTEHPSFPPPLLGRQAGGQAWG